jgi:hypothetical protein
VKGDEYHHPFYPLEYLKIIELAIPIKDELCRNVVNVLIYCILSPEKLLIKRYTGLIKM